MTIQTSRYGGIYHQKRRCCTNEKIGFKNYRKINWLRFRLKSLVK